MSEEEFKLKLKEEEERKLLKLTKDAREGRKSNQGRAFTSTSRKTKMSGRRKNNRILKGDV